MNKLIDEALLDLAEKEEGPCICGAEGECRPCKLALFASIAVANERKKCLHTIKVALDSEGDRDFAWWNKLLKDLHRRRL